MHNKTRKNCIKLIKTIEKCKKVVYYEAINKEETGRGTMNNEGGGIVVGGTMIDAGSFT